MGMESRDGMLRFNGIGECVTWDMYNNDAPTEAQKDAYFDVALWAAKRGLTLTQHWGSEKAVHHLLEVFERVNAQVPIAPLRWSIAHLHDMTPPTLERMKALGVGWLMQDALYYAQPGYLQGRGEDVLATQPAIVTALRLGVPVGGGTDAHRVMSYNPFVSLQWMLDGKTVAGLATRGPAEIPTREEALRIYTLGSAWFAFDETRRGSLEPGKLADLAVLSADYLTVPTDRIGHIESLLTLVGGKVVYAAEPYAALQVTLQ
jgi:predicted amidohydrolase YtcJ